MSLGRLYLSWLWLEIALINEIGSRLALLCVRLVLTVDQVLTLLEVLISFVTILIRGCHVPVTLESALEGAV